ncbi:hypothetical protein PUN28_014770 [Cardiocondyla obscurior]|uniref:Uncharacterized protein n=1 Tax=Cardiocondyla obscurior TaxID=286306 RepID=A0AAW2F0L3_9HYME
MTARAQAISVVNHYSVLVDGIISGFKDHLAEDVTLKWFGHEIRGKENVAAFMLTNKKRSFHKFSNIIPVPVVSCKQSNGEMNWSMKQKINCETYTNKYSRVAHSEYETKMSTTCENSENYDQINYEDLIHKKACDKYGFCIEECTDKLGLSKDDDYFDNDLLNFNVNKNKFSANAIAAMDDQSYDLNKYELYNLFEPKITSQPIVGKIQKINRIKLKEEMAPTVRAINRECGQRDRPTVEANATKYLEANGEIKLVRIDAQTGNIRN